jgi:tRNA threonylcarbamoyladenosine biosynthesis protein TsaE
MWNQTLPDLDATLAIGRALGLVAPSGTLVALRGELGAGKTSFAQGVGAGLGIAQPIVSPTFVLMAEYEGGRLPLLHADAYRLKSGEAASIGFEEAVELWPGVTLIEWADRVASVLPLDCLQVELVHKGEGRTVTVSATGPVHADLLERWKVSVEK